MKNKLIAMTVVLLSMCTGSVMAAVTQVECEKNFSDNTITVNGYAENGEQVSVHILKDGEISDSTVKESVVYVNQSETDAGGGFCFVVEVRDSGKYNVFVSGEDITVNSHKFPVVFYNSTDYAGVVNRLNEAAGRNDEDAFCSIIKDNAEKLGFDDEINEITDINKIGKLMYSGLNNKTLSADKYQENRDYYKNCAMMIASDEGKLDSIYKYADNIIENNSKLRKYWNRYITSEEKEAFAVKKLQNIKLDNVNELEKNISIQKLDSGRFHTGSKWIYSRFYQRQHLYRPRKKCMCARTELLFLSRRIGFLSDWFTAGGCQRNPAQFFLLCAGNADAFRCSSRPLYLRIFVSRWMVSAADS